MSGRPAAVYDTGLAAWVDIIGHPGPTGPEAEQILPFGRSGVLVVSVGRQRFQFPYACTILGVSATVDTAPTGADLIFDMNKNGTTLFTTQANRPRIVAGANATASEVTNMDVTAFAAGDYLTVDIDQIGSTIAGSDTTLTIRYQKV
jgi:hypothetical protein